MSISVLVIDDDATFRELAVEVLEGMGLSVVAEADTLEAGAAAATTLRPQAMLIDVALPDGSGVALARDLATRPWEPRIVLTSSDPGAVTQAVARAAGAVAFIPKQDLPGSPLGELLAGRSREE
jgi:CheY-like chemotaxis protein